MAYMKVDDITIPIFDGSDYSNWKKRIMLFLEFKECKEVATKAKGDKDNESEWKKSNVKAKNYIYSAISNKQLEYISDTDTAYQIIQKFDQMYLKQSTALQIVHRNNLENIKLQNFSDVTLFFDEFEKAVNELKAAGATVSEQEKLRYMLRALPSSYSHIGDLIDVLPKAERTVEYLKSKIKLKTTENKNQHEKNEENLGSNAFTTQMRGKCFQCGKSGHIQRNCYQLNNYKQQERGGEFRGGFRGRGNQRGNYRGNQRGGYRGNYRRGNNYKGAANTSYCQQDQSKEVQNTNSFITLVNASKVNLEDNRKTNQVSWILDSGCTDHIVNDDKLFDESIILKTPIDVKLGDGRVLQATKIGRIKTEFNVFGKRCEITVPNVFYVKDMKQNLISYSKVTVNNKIISFGNISKIYNKDNEVIAVARKEGNLYYMTSYIKNTLSREINSNMVNKENENEISLKEKWHRILGHINFGYLNTLCKNELLIGLPKATESDYIKCATCIESKMHNIPFINNRKQAEDILEIVHTDLNGPHATTGYCGEKYFLSFIDDYSKLAKVYCIKSKSEVYNCFVEYVNQVENLSNKKIKVLRCDNGKEYLNSNIFKFCREKGIRIIPCPPYVHELNGTAERFNRSIMDMSRCLLSEVKVNKIYWPEIVKTATYLKNRSLTNTIEKKTPYEIFFNERPNVKYLKLYGSKVFVRIPEQLRKRKWDKKAKQGILLGYSEVGYRILLENKIIEARHVDIIEENIKCIGFNNNENMIDKSSEICLDESYHSAKSESDNENAQTENEEGNQRNNGETELRSSSRVKKPNSRYYNDEFITQYVYVNYCSTTSLNTFEEAINSSESKDWKEAMAKEIESLNKNDTWKLVDRPVDKRIIDVKWIYTKKNDNTHKARLVAKGFQQEEHIDNIYSPVAKMHTLKLLLAFCCQFGFIIDQMDVETAFLNGKIVSEVYVNQPVGYNDGTDKVYKLFKSLYGLKESARSWYECFNKFVEELKFKRSNYDNCLYVKKENNEFIYILIFVDDMLICSTNQKNIDNIKSKLAKRFRIKDMNKVKTYIGIDIDYNHKDKLMTLSQSNYIESLANKYNLKNAKLFNTLMEISLKLEPTEIVNNRIKYRNLIGELLYISSGTRPDISFSVNYLSRFQNCYDDTHYRHALRVLKYLYLTKDLKLTYKKDNNSEILECYVDSDWAGDNVDRKSTSGYVLNLFGNVIYWRTHKQSSVTKASTFAEYVALSEAVTDVNFTREMLKETFYIKINDPIKIYEDNSGALSIAKNGNFTKHSKYIEVQYHYVHENSKEGLIKVIKIQSDENIADILTKSLSKSKFVKFREMLKLR